MNVPLVFQSLVIENFAGYYGVHSVRFPVGMRNVMLVRGRNTAGKTSFINAIKWCLYQTVSSRTVDRLPLADLFNSLAIREGREEMSVTLEMTIHGIPHTLKRTAKRKSSRYEPTADNDFEVALFMREGAEMLSESVAEARIAKVAPHAISRFFLFDGELLSEYETLIKSRGGKGSNDVLIEAIEDVIGIPAMTNGSKIIREASRLAKNEMQRLMQKQGDNANKASLLEQLNQKRQNLATEMEREEDRVAHLKEQEARLKLAVEEDRHAMNKHDRLRDIHESMARASHSAEEQSTRLANLGGQLWKDLLNASVERQSERIAIQALAARKSYDQDVINSHSTMQMEELLQKEMCSVCGQHLTSEATRRLRSQIEMLALQQSEREKRMREANVLMGKQAELASLLTLMHPASGAYTEAKVSRDVSINEQTRLEIQLEPLVAELANFNAQRARLNRTDLEEVSLEVRDLKRVIQAKSVEIERLDQSIDEHIKSISNAGGSADLEKMKKINAALSQLLILFEESREVLRERMRGHIEDIASKAYRKMIHEQDHNGIVISSKKYSMEIIDVNGNAVVEPSAGATQIMALSLIIALGRAGRSIGPIIMDTPFGRLDEDHRQRVMRHLPNYANQLVLLYHSGELQNASLRQIADQIGIQYEIGKHGESQSVIAEAN
jgi:DNA sulfur modification protein DndD